MRICIVVLAGTIIASSPCRAETETSPSSVSPEQRRAVSDERAAETRRMIEAARQRQTTLDRQNTDLWTRWIYAVCIGCDAMRARVKVVHTNPSRVLAGVPAALDDRMAFAQGRSVQVATRRIRQRKPVLVRLVTGNDANLRRPFIGLMLSPGRGDADAAAAPARPGSPARSG